jgi:hypothetical protein
MVGIGESDEHVGEQEVPEPRQGGRLRVAVFVQPVSQGAGRRSVILGGHKKIAEFRRDGFIRGETKSIPIVIRPETAPRTVTSRNSRPVAFYADPVHFEHDRGEAGEMEVGAS